MTSMDLGFPAGGHRKKPVTRAQIKKRQKAYRRADGIRLAKEKHHIREEIEADRIVDEELGNV